MLLIKLFLIPLALYCCESNVWNGIVPLKSTRADVEKILGKPLPSSVTKHAASYQTERGKVFVLYSTGPCSVKPSNGWNVPELTVISVSIDPSEDTAFKDLNLDPRKFPKVRDPDSLNHVFYTNSIDGISITVDEWDGSVYSYHFFPEAAFDNRLCEKRKR
jgi:hypothetical protein